MLGRNVSCEPTINVTYAEKPTHERFCSGESNTRPTANFGSSDYM